MRSTFAGLNTVVRGLYAQQVGLDTVGHNVSNASTDGYSRQSVNLATTMPGTIYGSIGKMQIGTGVDIASIARVRDSFIDKQFWKETSTLGYAQTKQKTLSQIESVFMEPSDSGLQTTLNNFWNAWQTLSTNASDNGVRTLVRQRGVDLVDSIKNENDKLINMSTDINSTLKIKVGEVNHLTSEIAALNYQITRIEVGNDNANDLRDQRDYLVDQLSGLMKVSVKEDQYGNYTIQSAGATLVDGDKNLKLQTINDTNAQIYTKYGLEALKIVTEGGQNLQFTEASGEIKALLDSRDSTKAINGSGFGVLEYMNQLDTISKFLMKDFNEVHRAGYGTDDSTLTNFFGDGTNGGVSDAAFNGWDDAWAQSQGGWVNALKVNSDFFTTDGVKYIAAKTQPGGEIVPVQTVGSSGGSVHVNGTYLGTSPGNYSIRVTALGLGSSTSVTQSNTSGGSAALSGTYTGTGTTSYSVRIDTLDIDTGKVTGASYSTDGGSTWTAGTMDTSTAPPTFTLSDGVKIAMNNDLDNSVGNTYNFSVSPASNDRVSGVEYSTDDGATWTTGTIDKSTNPPAFQLSLGVRVSIADNTGNTVNNTYTFTVTEGNASGGNAVKLAERLKTDKVATLGNASLDTYYAATIGTLGTDAQSAQKFADNQQTLVNQVLNWRESVSGVSIDEELTNMIKFQKGYNSAARVLTTMDEMLDKLINDTGRVGR
jgi:flagellar hook-associated protein 1 FlgK